MKLAKFCPLPRSPDDLADGGLDGADVNRERVGADGDAGAIVLINVALRDSGAFHSVAADVDGL